MSLTLDIFIHMDAVGRQDWTGAPDDRPLTDLGRKQSERIADEPGAIDKCAYFMDRVAELGFCDLWRHRYPDGREFSWYSHRGNGFRIDHAFLSPALARRAGTVRYSHDERLAGLSDHSALILELPR